MVRRKPRRKDKDRFELMQILALIGILLVLIGTFTTWIQSTWNISIIALISVILAFTNIKEDELRDFLIAAIALTVISSMNFSEIPGTCGLWLTNFVLYFKWLVAPATLILAVRELWRIMRA